MESNLDRKEVSAGSDPLSQMKNNSKRESGFKIVNNLELKKPEIDSRIVDFDRIKPINKIEENTRNIIFTEDPPVKEIINVMKQKKDLKSLGYQNDERLIGEQTIEICEGTSIILNSTIYEGILLLSNFKLHFIPNKREILESFGLRREFFQLPVLSISKIDKYLEKKTNILYLDILIKDFRLLKFKISGETVKEGERMFQLLESLRRQREYYSSEFLKNYPLLDNSYQYDILTEFKRMDILDSSIKIIDNNICGTYPELIGVPNRLTEENIIKCAKFRSRERLPILVYCHRQLVSGNLIRTYLWRASQCKSGLANVQRSMEDEEYLKCLGELSNYNEKGFLKIFDCRPFWNAVGNMMAGKGYENKENYRNCDVTFLDIHNIHKVRDSYKKLMTVCLSNDSPAKWYASIDASNWFQHLSSILSGSLQVAESIKKKCPTLVHCSDGWDRTSQVLSLTQIILDPFYRNIEGFIILIEKDWISCGHQFALRFGIGNSENESQRSPVFIQFLDCIHQLMTQFPLSFEFNLRFLCDIAFHLTSGYFGTFLFDNIQERNKFGRKYISLWSYLLSQREKYINPFYRDSHQIEKTEIWPNCSLKFLRLWKEHFLYFTQESKDPYEIWPNTMFLEDTINVEHFRSQEERKLLKLRVSDLSQDMRKLKKLLHLYEEKFGKLDLKTIKKDKDDSFEVDSEKKNE